MRLILALFHLLWTNNNSRARSVVLNQSHGGERAGELDKYTGPYYSSSILPNDVVINKASMDPKQSLPTTETLGNFTQMMNEITPATSAQSSRNVEINVTAVQERNLKPVLFFINRNSGGKVGATLIKILRKLELHPLQIVDLRRERPSSRLKMFKNCSENMHILTAGGDGTMNWILDEIRALNMTVGSFGVVPVGTGNDLYLEVLKNLHTKQQERGILKSELQSPITVRNLMFDPKAAIATHMQNMLGGGAGPERGVTPTVKLDRWRVRIKDRKVPREIMDKDSFGYDYEYDGTGYDVQGESSDNSLPEGQEVGDALRARMPGEKLALTAMRRGISLRRALRNLISALAARINPLRIIGKAARYRNMRMSNYMGFGVDGAVSLTLDNLRNYAPFLFANSLTNKFWYGVCGLFQIVFGLRRDLSKSTTLYCDGTQISLPQGVRGLVVLNINSYAGGVKLWHPETRPLDSKDFLRAGDNVLQEVAWGSAASDDGMLEVMGVYGIRHLGLIKSGIGRAVPICQGSELLFKFKNLIPVQVDGEPFMVRPCDVSIKYSEQINITTPLWAAANKDKDNKETMETFLLEKSK